MAFLKDSISVSTNKNVSGNGLTNGVACSLIRSSEFSDLLTASNIGVWTWNLDDQSLGINESVSQILGYDEGDITDLGIDLLKGILSEKDFKTLKKFFWSNDESNEFSNEIKLTSKNSKSVWAKVTIRVKSRKRNGCPAILQGTIIDVTNDHEVENVLEITENKFSAFIQSINATTWEWDCIRNEVTLSNQWLKAMGYEREDVVAGQEGTFFRSLIHPEDRANWRKTIDGSVLLGEKQFSSQVRLKSKRQGWRWILSSGVCIRQNEYGQNQIYLGADIDITPMKNKDVELNNWKTKLDKIIDATRTGLWIWDLKNLNFEANSQFARMFGFNLEEIKKLGINFLHERIHPDDKSIFFPESIPAKGYSENEIRIRHADESYLWIRVRLSVERFGEDGNPERLIGFCLNINSKKEAEVKIQESENRLSTLLAGTNAAIWEIDKEKDEFFFNDRLPQMMGHTKDEIENTLDFFDSRIHPADREKLRVYFESAGSDFYELEIRMRHKNGEWVWVLERGYIEDRFQDGRAKKALGIQLDISERKKLEEHLNDSLNQLQLAVNIGKIAVIENDLINHTVKANERYCEIYEVDEEEGSSNPELWKDLVTADDFEIAEKGINRLMLGEPVSNLQFRVSTKSGVKKLVTSATPIKDESGNVMKILGVLLDISNIAEKEIHLEKMVSQKSQMLKEMHHRIKNNLATISSIITLKSRNLENITDVKQFMDGINQKIVSMSVIHDRLLKEKEGQDNSLTNYLNDITNRLLGLANGDNLKINLEFKVEEYPFKEVVLLNLGMALQEIISNKIKHAFAGRDRGKLIIEGSICNGSYILKVGDNGLKYHNPKKVTDWHSDSIGMLIISSFISDLRGDFDFGPDKQGSTYTIRIPIDQTRHITEDDIARIPMSA